MRRFTFTKTWKKHFLKLNESDKTSIIKKLEFYKCSDSFFANIKILTNYWTATHRLRIWNLRVILEKKDENEYDIIKIWYRGDIYK
jgi:mRNA-degrading endonuclease RelE of RelBE toxin-antitoxin system